MAALLENSFTFLDGEEDDAKIIETAKVVAKKDAEDKEILKRQSEQAVKAGQRYRSAKSIILPRYNIVVDKEKPDGAEQNEAGSKFSRGNGDRGSYKGVDVFQGNNHRRDGNDYKGSYGGRGGYRGNNRRVNNNSGYNGSSNGSRDGDYYRNKGGNNGNYVGNNNSWDSLGVVDNDGWQISGRRRVGRPGQGRGYNVYTNGRAYESQVETVNQIQGHDDATLAKAAEGQVIEKPKSGEFEPGECHEKGNMLSGISEKDLSGVQHAVDGENKSILAEKRLDDDTAAEAISDMKRGDVADATTDGPKERSKKSRRKTQIEHNHVNKDKEGEYDSNKMTLEEYARVQLERGKSLESLKKVEQRQVSLDKDFESMHLVEKKSAEDCFIKLNTKKELLQRKDGLNKKEKARKSMSIDEFLKLGEVETSDMSGKLLENGRGQGHGQGYDGEKMNGRQQHHRPSSARGFVGERITDGHRQERSYNGHGYDGQRMTNGGLQHQRPHNGRGPRHHDGRKQRGSNGGGESGKHNASQHERPDFHHIDGYAAPAERLDGREPQHERPCNNGLGKGKELNVKDLDEFPALG